MMTIIMSVMLNLISIGSVMAQNPVSYHALLVCGSVGSSFEKDSSYMYHVLEYHYNFDNIYYLGLPYQINEGWEGVNDTSTKEHVRWAVGTWLNQTSDDNDIIFIFMSLHGGGYNTVNNENDGGRIDGSANDTLDEGDEIWNGTSYVGYDEYLYLSPVVSEYYWDDEFAADLQNVTYGKLAIAIYSCYGGGFIDDLSGSNRVIMTTANETYTGSNTEGTYTEPGGWPNEAGTWDGFSEWSEVFIDALHGEDAYWNNTDHSVHHKGVAVDADFDGDGHVSLNETWFYAWEYDDSRIDGKNTPWLDDNGNGLPNYWNGTDNWTGYPSSIPCDNGTLADSIWFPRKYCNLTVETRLSSGQEVSNVNVWVDGDLAGSSSITINVTVGYHEIEVESLISYQGCNYSFAYWTTRAPYQNPTNIHIHENTTVTAYYTATWYMQNDKWDSTYWKLDWNNTLMYEIYSTTKSGYSLSGYLGVRIYNGSIHGCDELTNSSKDPVKVGRWFNLESGEKSTTWELEDDVNVTDGYIKVEVYYKFQGDSWTPMDVIFKTEIFGQNAILKATDWTIYLWGSYYVEGTGPLGILAPPGGWTRSAISFSWGCSARESRIEDMILFSPP